MSPWPRDPTRSKRERRRKSATGRRLGRRGRGARGVGRAGACVVSFGCTPAHVYKGGQPPGLPPNCPSPTRTPPGVQLGLRWITKRKPTRQLALIPNRRGTRRPRWTRSPPSPPVPSTARAMGWAQPTPPGRQPMWGCLGSQAEVAPH